MAVRRDLSAEYRRRLDALETEWAARAATRSSELEAAHALKLQQVSGCWRHARVCSGQVEVSSLVSWC